MPRSRPREWASSSFPVNSSAWYIAWKSNQFWLEIWSPGKLVKMSFLCFLKQYYWSYWNWGHKGLTIILWGLPPHYISNSTPLFEMCSWYILSETFNVAQTEYETVFVFSFISLYISEARTYQKWSIYCNIICD